MWKDFKSTLWRYVSKFLGPFIFAWKSEGCIIGNSSEDLEQISTEMGIYNIWIFLSFLCVVQHVDGKNIHHWPFVIYPV